MLHCNNLRDNGYTQGGLRRCTEKRAAEKICERLTIYLSDTSNRLQRSKLIKNEDKL